MNTCVRMKDVEAQFDARLDSDTLREHLAGCPACSEHLRFLETTRARMRHTAVSIAEHPVNAERFLTDFRERVQTDRRGFRPVWALASAAAAACLVALSFLSIFAPGNGAVDARSYVESTSTEIEGATTSTYHAEDGTAIVWVNVPEGDMW